MTPSWHVSSRGSAPRRLSITSRCCASVSGRSCNRWKCSWNKSSFSPAGRDVTSITWPCGASTSVTCLSICARTCPPSSMPSSSSSARRAISAWRSIWYTSESAPCTHRRKASIQLNALAKVGRCSSISSRLCSSCTLTRIGIRSLGTLRVCATSCDIRHVLPAAGEPVSRMHAGALASPVQRAACAPRSQAARPPTSDTLRSASGTHYPSSEAVTSMGTHWSKTSSRLPERPSITLACCARIERACLARTASSSAVGISLGA